MNYFDLAHYPLPPPMDLAALHEYHDHGNNNYARVVQGVRAQAEAIAPPVPVFDIFGYVDQRAAAGPGLAHLDARPHQVPGIPALGEPATEILRRLANRYLNHPDSQVDTVRMEPGPAGGIRVVITLELADLF